MTERRPEKPLIDRSISSLDRPSDVSRKTYIVSPAYDWIFFICAPLLALLLGILATFTRLAEPNYVLYGRTESLITLFSGTFTMAHLVIVFFRSHLNPSIYRLYPRRFVMVPIVLFAAMMFSSWMLVFIFVLAIWWDVFHSSMQTFGLGRIYDLRSGNDPGAGRRLDQGLNLLLYVGPILAGAALFDHVKHFERFSEVGSAFFTMVPAYANSNQRYLTLAILAIGIPYLLYYVYAYRILGHSGYRISYQKVTLLAATGFCSVYTWGFNSFGQAFFIMNFFHALQYFAIVWWSEKGRMTTFFRLDRVWWGRKATFVLFLGIAFGYGFWAKIWGESSHLAFSVLLTVSIMHFWYDGFIWSVSKQQIPN